MEINNKAPEFSARDQNGETVALKNFRGKWVVLYFYPRANTPGCTIEACGFRDSFRKIENRGAVVVGVSPDEPRAQKKFEEKYDKKVMGVARTTFVIGPDGIIKHVFRKVKPEGHADEVLEYLKGAVKGAA